VEIRLAAGDVEGAADAAATLAAAAAEADVPFLHATSAQVSGAIAVAAGSAREGLDHLRRAQRLWTDLAAPYDVARVRVLIGRALADIGDTDGAALELDAAATTFRRLGATPDLARIGDHGTAHRADDGPLTDREREVLALVAAGRSNREIAGDLVISERTAARHVANILAKLDVPSRAAATAYGLKHRLI
jgi:DNA-binding NarL/FixJ family response regulator